MTDINEKLSAFIDGELSSFEIDDLLTVSYTHLTLPTKRIV